MHPLIERGRRLFVYLALFVPVALLLAELLRLTVGGGRFEMWLLVQPPLFVHAMSCLASWYLCRALPLGPGGAPALRVLTAQLAATSLAALWLLVVAAGWHDLLEGFGPELPAVREQSAVLIGLFGFFLYALAVVGHYLFLATLASRQAEKNGFELELLAQDAELRALRSQLDPHFLFNSLNAIAGLVGLEPEKARAMCVSLAAFLRHSLSAGQHRDTIPWLDELALVESYLAVERIRFGGRLRVELEAGDPALAAPDCRLPPLLLQPLVENAIRHGIAHTLDGGRLAIAARRSPGELAIVVRNDCDPDRPSSPGHGVGLENVARRLRSRYGDRASMTVRDEGTSFCVALQIPLAEAGERGHG